MNQYHLGRNEYYSTVDEIIQAERAYKEKGVLIRHYDKNPSSNYEPRQSSLQEEMVARIDIAKSLKLKAVEWEQEKSQKETLRKETEELKVHASKIAVGHDKTWKQLVEVITENACARKDAMLNDTYQRSDYELNTLTQNMYAKKSPEPQKAPEQIAPVKVEGKKNSGPQLG